MGVDTASTFCYLLSQEEHRDADTWGVRLLELAERGFAPDAIVADFGTGLRAGQALALPQVPCRGDVFHLIHDLEPVVTYLENRAYDALECLRTAGAGAGPTSAGRAGPRRAWPSDCGRPAPPATRPSPWRTMSGCLAEWLRHDVLAVAGPCYAERLVLYDFILAELRAARRVVPAPAGPASTGC